jgi:glucose-6-phosphate isomerase
LAISHRQRYSLIDDHVLSALQTYSAMPKSPIVPLTYDLARAVNPQAELSSDDLVAVAPQLAAARRALLDSALQPATAGFVSRPDRLLEDYRANRHLSDLGRILSLAKRLNAQVDRVVLLGNRQVQLAARALFEGCCHPFHNELTRGERGGYPRLDFDGDHIDNDATQGLIDLLGRDRKATDVNQRWAIVVASHEDSSETNVAFRHYLSALRASCGHDESQLARLVIDITNGRQHSFEIEPAEVFHSAKMDERFAIFTPAALLSAAIVGLDIVKLIRGAAAMNAHFRQAAVDRNLVLQFAVIAHLMQTRCGRGTRIQAMWSRGLEATGRWHEQLHVGNRLRSCDNWKPFMPESSFITNFISDGVRRDRLALTASGHLQTMPELLAEAVKRAQEMAASVSCPSVDLHLPHLDEPSLGHLLQMLMLAAAVESQLTTNVPPA